MLGHGNLVGDRVVLEEFHEAGELGLVRPHHRGAHIERVHVEALAVPADVPRRGDGSIFGNVRRKERRERPDRQGVAVQVDDPLERDEREQVQLDELVPEPLKGRGAPGHDRGHGAGRPAAPLERGARRGGLRPPVELEREAWYIWKMRIQRKPEHAHRQDVTGILRRRQREDRDAGREVERAGVPRVPGREAPALGSLREAHVDGGLDAPGHIGDRGAIEIL